MEREGDLAISPKCFSKPPLHHFLARAQHKARTLLSAGRRMLPCCSEPPLGPRAPGAVRCHCHPTPICHPGAWGAPHPRSSQAESCMQMCSERGRLELAPRIAGLLTRCTVWVATQVVSQRAGISHVNRHHHGLSLRGITATFDFKSEDVGL